MSKRRQSPEEIPPSVTKAQGRQALLVMKEKGEKLLSVRPIPEATFDTWSQSSFEYIQKTFGSESGHISNFCGQGQITFGSPGEQYLEQRRFDKLQERIAVLASLIEQLETEIGLETPKPLPCAGPQELFWSLLHPSVVATARTRFEAGHYADSVEAALKELNTRVKELVRKKTGNEFDGAPLMQKAFSPNPPVLITLDDLSTESGRNIQQGYMQIFAGAMIGIRNPKAHANLSITKERAIHFLFLASLLFNTLDERL
jgi:uncharacterized protein (TIGR02391 family)